MNLLKHILSALAVVAIAGCGGGKCDTSTYGGGAGTCEQSNSPPPVVVSNMTLTLSAAAVNNTGTETVTATVVATNSSNQIVSGALIDLSVNNEATIAVDGNSTDTEGKLSGVVGIGDNKTNRTITVTATANNGALVRSKSFVVSGATLTATPVPATLPASTDGVVQYRLIDAANNAMSGVQVVVTGPSGVETTGTTDVNGRYDYKYTAPATAGESTIRAQAAGDSVDSTVLVTTGSGTIPNVDPTAFPIRSASVQASPSVVPVNLDGATTNQSQLRALFVTNSNAPVKNIRVRFDLNGDANSIGGTFTTGTTLVYSDANGVATSSYVPATRSSPTDGVTIRACWDYADFPVGTCPNNARTTLTVTADPVSVTIGTNNLVQIGTSGLTYVKRYVVQVVDSSGLAKPDVQVATSIDLLQYLKGFWTLPVDKWVQTNVNAVCDNEDINRNNVLEIYSNGGVEDANGNGKLDPRKADVAVSFDGPSKTDANGQVVVKIEYPQNMGSWVIFDLLATAGGVTSTEGRTHYVGVLPVLATHVNDKNADPPFRLSPYGTLTSGTTVVTSPEGKSASLCTNGN